MPPKLPLKAVWGSLGHQRTPWVTKVQITFGGNGGIMTGKYATSFKKTSGGELGNRCSTAKMGLLIGHVIYELDSETPTSGQVKLQEITIDNAT